MFASGVFHAPIVVGVCAEKGCCLWFVVWLAHSLRAAAAAMVSRSIWAAFCESMFGCGGNGTLIPGGLWSAWDVHLALLPYLTSLISSATVSVCDI